MEQFPDVTVKVCCKFVALRGVTADRDELPHGTTLNITQKQSLHRVTNPLRLLHKHKVTQQSHSWDKVSADVRAKGS